MRTDHVSRVFDVVTDLSHLMHPFLDSDPFNDAPSVANRVGAVALLVLSFVATLGTLTGFYFYRAHRKVVHLEKKEFKEQFINDLYREVKQPKKEGFGLAQKLNKPENKTTKKKITPPVLEKEVVCEDLGSLNSHQKNVVKIVFALEKGKTIQALAGVKYPKKPFSLEEKRLILKTAIIKNNLDVVENILEIEKENKELKILNEELLWSEIRSEEVFQLLWEFLEIEKYENRRILSAETQNAIMRVILIKDWVEKISYILELPLFESGRGHLVFFPEDIQSKKMFDAFLLNSKEKLKPNDPLSQFFISVVIQKDWIEKIPQITDLLGSTYLPWENLDFKSEKMFKTFWEKVKNNNHEFYKKTIMGIVIKNDWIDLSLQVWVDLKSVEIPWEKVKSQKMLSSLWEAMDAEKKDLDLEYKNSMFLAIVKMDFLEKVSSYWQELGSICVPWNKVKSPEMLRKLREEINFDDEEEGLEAFNYGLVGVKNLAVVKQFNELGAVAKLFDDGSSALHQCKNPEVAKYLLSNKGFEMDVNLRDAEGVFPVPLYTTPSNVQKVLIEQGADVCMPHPDGYTLLHVCEDPKIARLLLKKGALVNAQDADGCTPLHLCNNFEIARLLVKYGADRALVDNEGKTPLETITNLKILKMLKS